MKVTFELERVESIEQDTVARVYYPDIDGVAKIQIVKGLDAIQFSEAIYHEIGHIFDWYFGEQSKDVEIREKNAVIIGQSLRFRESCEPTKIEGE